MVYSSTVDRSVDNISRAQDGRNCSRATYVVMIVALATRRRDVTCLSRYQVMNYPHGGCFRTPWRCDVASSSHKDVRGSIAAWTYHRNRKRQLISAPERWQHTRSGCGCMYKWLHLLDNTNISLFPLLHYTARPVQKKRLRSPAGDLTPTRYTCTWGAILFSDLKAV